MIDAICMLKMPLSPKAESPWSLFAVAGLSMWNLLPKHYATFPTALLFLEHFSQDAIVYSTTFYTTLLQAALRAAQSASI